MSAAAFIPPSAPAPGWPTSHLMTTILAPKLSGLVEYVCVHKILNLTHGAPRRPGTPPPEWSEPISPKQLGESAGASDRAADYALAHALKAKLIERKKCGKLYCYRVTPEHWEAAPKYSPESIEKGEEKAKASRSPLRDVTPITVKPGRRSPLEEVSQVIENATHIQFEIDKNLSALSIQRLVEAGHVIFSIKSAEPTPNSRSSASPPAKSFQPPHSINGKSTAGKLDPALEWLVREIGRGPTADEIKRITSARGAATAEQLSERLQKLKKRRDFEITSYGLVEKVAREDCAPHPWKQSASEHQLDSADAVYVDGVLQRYGEDSFEWAESE